MEECFEKILNSWTGKHLSILGCLKLISSVLTSLPMYIMSFFSISRCVLKNRSFALNFTGKGDKQKRNIISPSGASCVNPKNLVI